MRKWLILLSALSGTAASAAPAWTWVDSEGTRHYSDRPVPGAEQVELIGAQAFGSSRTPRAARTTGQGDASGVPCAPYQSIEVVSPAEQETLWNIGTNLPVQVRFQPALQPGHRYDLLYDGQRRNVVEVVAERVQFLGRPKAGGPPAEAEPVEESPGDAADVPF